MVVQDQEIADALELEPGAQVVLRDDQRIEIPIGKQLQQLGDTGLDKMNAG